MTEAEAECEALMNATYAFVEQTLCKLGRFPPFGGAIDFSGEYVSIPGYAGDEQPPPAEVVDLLKRSLVRGARRTVYRATVLAYDVLVAAPATGQTINAIAFALDHRDNHSVVVYRPYKLEAGIPVFGEAFAEPGDRDIFRRPKRPWWAIGLYLIHNPYARLAFVAGIFILLCWLGFFARK